MLGRSLLSMCLLGVSACSVAPASGSAGGGAAASGPPTSLAGTRWVGAQAGADAASVPRLEFVAEGRISGYTGCNMLSGTWRMEGGEVRFGAIATTKRMCMGPGGEVEKRLLAALEGDPRARREGAKLVVGTAGARFEFTEAK